MSAAVERIVEALERGEWKLERKGDGVRAQCPAHSGDGKNLSVRPGNQGALLYCHSQHCAPKAVMAALSLTEPDMFDDCREARYDYGRGHVVHRSHTDKGKKIWQDSAPTITALYRHPDATAIEDASRVLLVEGEKCVDAALRLGAGCVTTWPGGTGGVGKVDLSPLAGRDVVLIPDNDAPGEKAMRAVRARLAGIAKSVQVWAVPAQYGDIADLYAAEGTREELKRIEWEDEPHSTADDAAEPDALAVATVQELLRMRARREALRLLSEEDAPKAALPRVVRLDQFLAEPDEDAKYRVEGLLLTGGNVVLASQYKAGKSTTVANLVHSLADGLPFLGRFETHPARRIVLIDNELDERTQRRWMRDHGIRQSDRVEIISLRGSTGLFNIMDDAVRARWALLIGAADVLIFDCLRPVLDALGLSEDKDAGKFLVALDALKSDARIQECVVVHHMGHSGERSRGDSRILDWPDATWRIVRENEDPSSPRYFSALGRDVDVHEGRLEYDHATRSLTYGEGSRKEGKLHRDMQAVMPLILAHVASTPGCSGRNIEENITGADNGAIRQARGGLVTQGQLVEGTRQGKGGGKAYWLAGQQPNRANRAEPRSSAEGTALTASISAVRSSEGEEEDAQRSLIAAEAYYNAGAQTCTVCSASLTNYIERARGICGDLDTAHALAREARKSA